jgi:hypothetical protein
MHVLLPEQSTSVGGVALKFPAHDWPTLVQERTGHIVSVSLVLLTAVLPKVLTIGLTRREELRVMERQRIKAMVKIVGAI